MDIREVALRSPRHPGHLVRIKLLANFTNFRAVDDIAPLAVDIMNHRAPFSPLLFSSAGFVATQLALKEASNSVEQYTGRAMLQAIKATLIPANQPIICWEALRLLRDIEPTFTYPTECRQA